MRKIILNLGTGTLSGGCPTVLGEIVGDSSSTGTDISRIAGQLPAALALAAVQQQWQQFYRAHYQNIALRIQLLQREGLQYSESDFKQLCLELTTRLNQWLNAPEFLAIDRALRSELSRTDNVQIILETSDPQIQRLPWHHWQLLEAYPNVELSFSALSWHPLTSRQSLSKQLRILATFGSSNGLDLSADLTRLKALPNSEVSVLEAPRLNQLHEQLWQPQGWDIFFFAGHSQTHEKIGVVDLNEHEQLTIDQIKYALSQAIQNGLKIAIFNSCDGLGLARQLSDLQIPYIVVMREPVPDYVAQQFLQYLLTAFASGQPFHQAVGEARQRLAGLDNELPCASWLPIIWQNPTSAAIYWQDLQPQEAKSLRPRRRWRQPLLRSLLVGGALLCLRALGVLEPMELAAYDRLMRSRPAEPVDARMVVVEASEETTSEYGYPLPDDVLTTVVDRIKQSQPLAIGLDLHRGQPRPALGIANPRWPLRAQSDQTQLASSRSASSGLEYARFLQQVEQTPNLFLVCAYSSADANYQAPLALSERSRSEQIGFSDLPTDNAIGSFGNSRGDLLPEGPVGLAGEAVRRHVLSYDPDFSTTPSACTTPYSFSLRLAAHYLGEQPSVPIEVTPDEHWKMGSVTFQSLPSRFGGYQGLGTPSSQILLNYRGSQPAQKISMEQLISGSFDPALLRDRIVLVGYNAPVSKDYFETPYGPMSGVWIHTHMVSQLVSAVIDERPLIGTLPHWGSWQWGDWLWILAWSSVGGYVGGPILQKAILRKTAREASQVKATQVKATQVKATQVKARTRLLISLWMLTMGLSFLLLYAICWLAMTLSLWLPLIPSGLGLLGAGAAATAANGKRSISRI